MCIEGVTNLQVIDFFRNDRVKVAAGCSHREAGQWGEVKGKGRWQSFIWSL